MLEGRCHADRDVEGIHHRLREVLPESSIPQAGEIDAVERRLVPEVGFGKLLLLGVKIFDIG